VSKKTRPLSSALLWKPIPPPIGREGGGKGGGDSLGKKIAFKIPKNNIKVSQYMEYSRAEQLCDEFVRLYGHIPIWKSEIEEFQTALQAYRTSHVRIGGPFTDEMIEGLCTGTLAYWKHMMKGERAQELKSELGIIDTQPFYLVTINYAPNFANWQFMNEVVQTLASFKNVVSIRHVHEYHGEGENHPHTHMLMRVKKKQKPSELVKMVYEAKGVSKNIGGANFINVTKKPKSYEEYCEYIDGHKSDKKLPNVALDMEWRAERGLV